MEFEGYKIAGAAGRMFEIKPKGKGSVPANLRGLYTSLHEVKKAIVAHKEGKSGGK